MKLQTSGNSCRENDCAVLQPQAPLSSRRPSPPTAFVRRRTSARQEASPVGPGLRGATCGEGSGEKVTPSDHLLALRPLAFLV
jgi:hypothetical protein